MNKISTEIEKTDASTLKSFLTALNAGVMKKTNCKFCQSPHRAVAEEYYEENHRNIKQTLTYLASLGEKFSYRCVRNHLQRHYISEESVACLQEYGSDLALWVNRQLDIRQRIIERISILEREMVMIAALSVSEDLEGRRRTADTLKKLAEVISAHEVQLREIDRSQEPLDAVIEKLRDIVSQKIQVFKDNNVKNALLEVVGELSQSMSEILNT